MMFWIRFLLIISIIVYGCVNSVRKSNNSAQPEIKKKPTNTKKNDKLILVENVNQTQIKQVLKKFCSLYNSKNYTALPRLFSIGENKFVVTFPYDTDFETFCYAVNFLKYPTDIICNPMVSAWLTTPPTDDWITDKTANKKVMLFLAVDDKEYDNVFLTTQDNIGYKLGFAMGREKQLLASPKENYISPMISFSDLTNMKFEDFE